MTKKKLLNILPDEILIPLLSVLASSLYYGEEFINYIKSTTICLSLANFFFQKINPYGHPAVYHLVEFLIFAGLMILSSLSYILSKSIFKLVLSQACSPASKVPQDLKAQHSDKKESKIGNVAQITRILKSPLVIFDIYLLFTYLLITSISPTLIPRYQSFQPINEPDMIRHDNSRILSTALTTNYGNIIGISLPSNSVSRVRITPDKKFAIFVNYNFMYSYSLDDLTNPTFVSSIAGTGHLKIHITPNGNYALWPSTTTGLNRVTLTNGVLSNLITVTLSSFGTCVWASNTVAWVGTSGSGIQGVTLSTMTVISGSTIGTGQFADLIGSLDGNTLYAVRVNNGLYVYNIANPASPSLITSFTGSDYARARTLTMSSDGTRLVMGDSTIIFDITTPTSPTLLKVITQTTTQGILVLSDQKTMFSALQSSGVAVYDISSASYPQIGYIFTGSDVLDVTEYDNSTIVLACSDGIKIISLTPPALSNVVPPIYRVSNVGSGQYMNIRISNDGRYLYSGSTGGLRVFDIFTNRESPALLTTVGSIGWVRSVEISADDKTLYTSGDTFRIYDVTNPSSPVFKSSYAATGGYDLKVTSDNYAFVFQFSSSNFIVLDVSNPLSITLVHTSATSYTGFSNFLSPDEKYFSYFQRVLDITDRSNPVRVAFTSSVAILAYSSNKKLGYACTSTNFHIYDMSTYTNPIRLSALTVFSCSNIWLSREENIVYITDGTAGIKAINVLDPYRPRIINAIYQSTQANDIAFSPLGNYMYCTDMSNGLYTYRISATAVLNLTQQYFIGQRISQQIQVFQKSGSTYRAFPSYYKLTKFGIYTISYNGGITIESLPTWIFLSTSAGTIIINPTVSSSVGDYTFYLAISTQVPSKIFNGVGGITTDSASADLVTVLVQLGYMDANYYLTENYNPSTTMLLPSTYSSNEAAFRSTLSNYFYETMTTITINSSLTVSFSNATSPGYINMTSQSSAPATVKITLYNDTYFIKSELPVLATYSSDNSIIMLTGSSSDIMNTLSQLRINMTGNSSDGLIYIDDGMNPVYTAAIKNINQFLIVQQAPFLIDTIPGNVSRVSIVKGRSYQFSTFFATDPQIASKVLTYSFYTLTNGVVNSINPSYMRMDSTRGLFTVTPAKTDVVYDAVTSVYYANFTVVIIATDSGGLTCSYQFDLLIRNDVPTLSLPIQPQINRYKLQTGFAYTIKLDPSTFIDPNGDDLTYTLLSTDGSSPGVSFKSYDMSIEGTAPDEIGTITLILKADNGIQSRSESFTLEFTPSVAYWFNKLIQYVGALIGVIGLYVYLPLLYNIFYQTGYRYFKIYRVDPNVEITDDKIFPICFLGVYNYEAQELLTLIKRNVKSEAKVSSDEQFCRRYVKHETKEFDDEKLKEDIDLADDTTAEIKLGILQEIIKDHLIDKIINLSENRKTRKVFKYVKSKWHEVIKPVYNDIENPVLSCLKLFTVDEVELGRYIKKGRYISHNEVKILPQDLPKNSEQTAPQQQVMDIQIYDSVSDNARLSGENSHQVNIKIVTRADNREPQKQKSSLSLPGVNLALLKDALISEARKRQNFFIDANRVEIAIMKRVKKNILPGLFSFLKFDLEDAIDGDDSAYGLEAKLEHAVLKFGGKPNFDFAGREIFIQIKRKPHSINPGEFILREIAIRGNPLPRRHHKEEN